MRGGETPVLTESVVNGQVEPASDLGHTPVDDNKPVDNNKPVDDSKPVDDNKR
jgi:hypothetical protein